MKSKVKFAIFLIFLVVATVRAQNFTKTIQGRVYGDKGDISGVHVSNISLNKGSITDIAGYFTISGRLNDTLVISAVQFKRVELVITSDILEKDMLHISLKESLTLLDEVVVTPYNLTGDLTRDMGNMKIEPIVTASTLGLPNAYVKVKTQNERKLFEADAGPWIYLGNYKLDTTFNPVIMVNLNKILNRVTGRTQKIKTHIAIDEEIKLLQNIKRAYPDSVYIQELQLSKDNLDEFFYFCEADSLFTSVAETGDKLRVWEFLQLKSRAFRSNKPVPLKE